RRDRRREDVGEALVVNDDIRLLAQALEKRRDLLRFLLLLERVDDLRLERLEGRLRRRLVLFDLDDVIAEGRFYRRGRLPDRSREGGVLERRDHRALRKEAELAAFILRSRVGRILLRKRGEVAARFKLR